MYIVSNFMTLYRFSLVTINSTIVSLSWDEVNCADRNRIIIVQYSITGGITVIYYHYAPENKNNINMLP